MSDNAHGLGFRRRCGWCGVQLRWWQLNLCRVCRIYGVVLDMPSPPCLQRSRWDAAPDGMTQEPEGSE
jgi:hypothetical protein